MRFDARRIELTAGASMPLVNAAYNPETVRPMRMLGVRGLWLVRLLRTRARVGRSGARCSCSPQNHFHGGKTLSTQHRTSFYTGLVWSTEYIGPMKF